MNNLGKRIKVRRKLCNFTQIDVAKRVGVTKAAVSRWENGMNTIAADRLDVLANILGVNSEWLLSGDRFASEEEEKSAVFWAPLYSQVKAAAENSYIDNDEFIPIPKIHIKYQNNLNDIFCLIVTGDSMAPMINDGSIIAINKSLNNISDGKLYLIRQHELLRVKIISQKPNKIILKSFNNKYSDEAYNFRHNDIEILGEVVWFSSIPAC